MEESCMPVSSPLKIAAKYTGFGIAWIVFSDYALELLRIGEIIGISSQTLKGSLFVLISAAIIYVLVKRDFDRNVGYKNELERSQALLQETQRLTRSGGWEYDPATKRMTWTEETYRIHGVSKETFDPGRIDRDIEFYHPDDQEAISKAFRDALEHGQPYDLELRFRDAEGRPAIVRTIGRVEQHDGRVVRVYGNIMDITEQKQTEERLRESERTLQTLMSNLPGMAYRCRNTLEWPMEFVSHGCKALTGYSAEEIMAGDPVNYGELIHPEDQDSVWQSVQQAVQDNQSFVVEYRILTRSGAVQWVWEQGRQVGQAADGAGVLEGFVTDITERRQAEEALRQKVREMETFIDNIPYMAWLKDADSNFILVNQSFGDAVGMDPAYLKSNTCAVCFGDELAGKMKEDDREVIEQRASITIEESIVDKDGRTRYLETNKSPILDDQGAVVGTVGIGVDITDRKRAEEEKEKLNAQLRQALKMEAIGTLTGGIAHDFNNSLGIILGYTQLARRDLPDESPASKALAKVESASLRARDVVRQLLTFSRKEEQGQQVMDLGPIVKETLKMLRSSIPTSIDFQIQIDSGLPLIKADPTQMHQVMLNLCSNASDAMAETGGILTVSLEPVSLTQLETSIDANLTSGDYVKLTVKDIGPGITAENMERIFDPYFTTKTVDKGTGMGLAVVHGIVKSHGGGIRVSSQPGHGAAFEIYIPATEERPGALHTEHDAGLMSGSEHILLVDDEELIVRVNQDRLEDLGYQVTSTTDPGEALELLTAAPERYDLVITDMTMPSMTGDKLAEKMLAIVPELPIILCTGFSERISEESAKALGIAKYIEKPLDLQELALSVRQVLGPPSS
jgi:PAS domain S-box-containing protein